MRASAADWMGVGGGGHGGQVRRNGLGCVFFFLFSFGPSVSADCPLWCPVPSITHGHCMASMTPAQQCGLQSFGQTMEVAQAAGI